MTRLLYWNIRDFALNKIQNPVTRKRQRGASLSKSDASNDRLLHIVWLINMVSPDIFVLVETETTFTGAGQLVQGNGRLGAELLLNAIRIVTGNNDWMLVPPLQTGPNEAVSVYYRSTNRYFTGPYVWPGGGVATAQAPGGATANYPASLNAGMPGRAMLAAIGGTPERQRAARVTFTRAAHDPNAGAAMGYAAAGQRAPYMTTFAETAGAAVQRNLTIFSIHAPASGNARAYLRDLENVAQIVDGLAANEVRVVIGDFNWNLLDNALMQRGSYNLLVGRGYTLALQPLAAPPAVPNGYKGYFATHIAHTDNAVYWSTMGNPVYYPAYEYQSETDYAIDNIFTRYGGGVGAGGPAANFTVINTVVGSPYNLHPLPAPGTPAGNAAFTVPIDMEILTAPPQPGPAYTVGLLSTFRGWEEYGHIYSVSDHLPLAIDL